MHRDRVHRARRIALLAAFFIPIAQLSHATDGMLYARAIGDPQLPAAAAPTPSPTPRRDIPELPELGTAPPQTQTVPTTEPSGWSWKQILIGVGVVVAISAIASRGGGSSGGDNGAPPITESPPPSGDGGGGIAAPAPVPTPTPEPTPTPPPSGGGGDDDDDDDKGKKGGKGDRRILIPAFSASFN